MAHNYFNDSCVMARDLVANDTKTCRREQKKQLEMEIKC